MMRSVDFVEFAIILQLKHKPTENNVQTCTHRYKTQICMKMAL